MSNFIVQQQKGVFYTDAKSFRYYDQAVRYLKALEAEQPNINYRIFDVKRAQSENEALLASVDWKNITCEDIGRAIDVAFSSLPEEVRIELCKALSDELAVGM